MLSIDETIENLKYDIEIDMYIHDIAPQLAEWLEELKVYQQHEIVCHKGYNAGYNKAIDDLMEKVSECFISDADWNYLVQEAAQLKAGGGNEK